MLHKQLQLAQAEVIASGLSMYLSKTPLLVFYIRVFGVKNWLRWTCLTTLVLTAVSYLGSSAYAAVHCSPKGSGMDQGAITRCMEHGHTQNMIHGFTSVFADMLILCLPLTIVSKLHLPPSKKAGLTVVFLLGIL